MITIIIIFVMLGFCVPLAWQYVNLDRRWIKVCHTLGVSSRKTHPRDVLYKLETVVAKSKVFDEFIQGQIDNDYEEVDDVEPDPAVQE